MKIIIDSGLKQGVQDGIGTYFHNLTQAIQDIFFDIDLNIQPDQTWYRRLSWPPLGLRKIPYLFWNNFFLPQIIDKQHIDVLHGINMVLPMKSLTRCKSVLTIYDLSYLRYPETLPLYFRLYYKLLIPRMVLQADHIITISDFTKYELNSLLKVPNDKISVTHLAPKFELNEKKYLSQNERENVLGELKINKPYMLTVGTIEPRKNLPRLIKAFSVARQELKIDLTLVVVGIKGWLTSNTYKEVSGSMAKPDIKFLDYIPNDILNVLYQEAMLFIYPSLYEGFGLPILEAMTLGVPVVTSNTASMPEISGDAALLVNPLDVNSIASGIIQLAEDDELRTYLIGKGRKRALEFSWEATARQTVSVYEQLLSSS